MDYFSETKQECEFRVGIERNKVPHSLEPTGDESGAIPERQGRVSE